MRHLLLFFSLLIFSSFIGENNKEESILYLEVEGIERVEGNIGVLVFKNEEGFPKKAEKAVLELEVKVTSTRMKIELKDLPFGDYAFCIIQDINSNKEMDVNFIGIPKEPYGFSNNPNTFFGMPNFKQALVSFTEKQRSTTIKLVSF